MGLLRRLRHTVTSLGGGWNKDLDMLKQIMTHQRRRLALWMRNMTEASAGGKDAATPSTTRPSPPRPGQMALHPPTCGPSPPSAAMQGEGAAAAPPGRGGGSGAPAADEEEIDEDIELQEGDPVPEDEVPEESGDERRRRRRPPSTTPSRGGGGGGDEAEDEGANMLDFDDRALAEVLADDLAEGE
eukprot:tig00000249_g22159.t1